MRRLFFSADCALRLWLVACSDDGSPDDGACGVKLEMFAADPNAAAPTVSTIDCGIDALEALAVRSFLVTREP
jgi:hypothetical protein